MLLTTFLLAINSKIRFFLLYGLKSFGSSSKSGWSSIGKSCFYFSNYTSYFFSTLFLDLSIASKILAPLLKLKFFGKSFSESEVFKILIFYFEDFLISRRTLLAEETLLLFMYLDFFLLFFRSLIKLYSLAIRSNN